MNTYSLTSPKFEGALLFRYDDKGWLIYYENKAQLDEGQLTFVLKNLPRGYGDLVDFATKTKSTTTIIPQDLSFAVFWKKYDHKVGKKDRAEKLWNSYSETERANILKSISAYDAYLAKTNQNKAYPETYLSQKRHENEYK